MPASLVGGSCQWLILGGVEAFRRFEGYDFARGYHYRGAFVDVAGHLCLALLGLEGAEAAEGYFLAVINDVLNYVEGVVYYGLDVFFAEVVAGGALEAVLDSAN